jgi:CDP-diacylglycerol--glycerol-3-phosphate 3-phosphatidyltransferase
MSTSTPGSSGTRPQASHWNLPNTLTWLRILMIPAIVLLFYLLPYPWGDTAACAAFALAGITDSLDGYYARKLGLTSRLGAFLDPVADKLIVAAALILIVSRDPRWFMAIAAIVIIGREIAISALREWMAKVGQAKSVAVAAIGKLKTVAQMVAIPLLLYSDWLFDLVDCQWLGTILINVAAVLTVASMLYYLRRALPHALNSR